MPTYVYRREDGSTFEVFHSIVDAALTEDPETGAPVTRVISGGAGLQFKGSGFYLTDYPRKGSDQKAGEKKERGEKADSGKAGGEKSEAKSEAKGEAKAEKKEAKPAPKPAAKGDD